MAMISLASLLRREREKRGWTQRVVARKLEVALNTVQAWERPDDSPLAASVPNAYQIRAIAKLYGVTADKLLQHLPPTKARAAS